MKLFRNPDRLFFFLVIFITAVLAPFSTGIEGKEWMQAYKPFAEFFLGIIWMCLGPWLILTALKAKNSESTVTVWRKTWPVTFALGILSPLGGAAILWAPL